MPILSPPRARLLLLLRIFLLGLVSSMRSELQVRWLHLGSAIPPMKWSLNIEVLLATSQSLRSLLSLRVCA